MRRPNSVRRLRDATPLGVDIGTYRTKAIVTGDDFDGVAVTGVISFDNPPGAMASGAVESPRKLGKMLAEKLDSRGAQSRVGRFSVPSGTATLKWVKVPLLEGDELREAARFKVKRHLPFDAAEAYIAASRPVPDADAPTGLSLVIAVPRAVIDSRAETLLAAGIEPVGAELEAQAILRVVERSMSERGPLWRDASITVIDLGGAQTHMYVVQNRRLQFVHGVRFGADSIVQSVSERLGIPMHHAGAALVAADTKLNADGTIDVAMGDKRAAVDAAETLGRLTQEFVRLLRYFRSLHPERSYAGILEHAVACGGLASLSGLPEYLERSLGLRVELACPFSGTIAQVEEEELRSAGTRQEAFTVAMGLALAGPQGRREKLGTSNDQTEFSWIRTA